jgi:AcrR family transcriptional regulator
MSSEVPRTRPEIDREAKVAEILSAAERRLLDGGYEALSVAAIARELGLAQNAIYWYFPSKNDLFVAALRKHLQEMAARKPSSAVGIDERILFFADGFSVLFDLRGALTEQARQSDVVAAFAKELDGLIGRMLTNALRDRVAAKELPATTEALRAAIIGTYAQGLDRRARRALLSFVLQRLTA